MGVTVEEMEHGEGDVDEGSERRGLMVMPLEVLDSVFELGVVVESVADIDDEVFIGVLIVEVLCNIGDAISVQFFK